MRQASATWLIFWVADPLFLHHQHRFLHGLALLLEHVHLSCPIVAGAKPRKILHKGGVVLPSSQPCAVVNQSQRAQGLNQRELAAVEKLDERGAVQRITDVLSKSARGRRAAEAEAEEGDAETKAA